MDKWNIPWYKKTGAGFKVGISKFVIPRHQARSGIISLISDLRFNAGWSAKKMALSSACLLYQLRYPC